MKKSLSLLFLLAQLGFFLNAQDHPMHLISSFKAESKFDEGASEIVAYDSKTKKLFSTNGFKGRIDVIDISNPSNPKQTSSILYDSIGGGANSVAVKDGILAVAVEADKKTDNGFIVFYKTDGTYIKKIEVGALPDNVVFSPDGKYVLSANEGEPNDGVNPEGSISIIDISGDVENATVKHAKFTSYNNKKYALRNKGVRIFDSVMVSEDPDMYKKPSVAEDLEPEYIAVTENSKMAYVTLQENNAFAVVDIMNAEVIDILPAGLKNHNQGKPMVSEYLLNELPNFPSLGTPVYEGGKKVLLGGFSGLYFDHKNSSENEYVFYAIPDRGPNDDNISAGDVNTHNGAPVPVQNIRPFQLPNYQARIVKFTYNPVNKTVALDSAEQKLLFAGDGTTPITGRGNIPGADEVPVTYADKVEYKDTAYSVGDSLYFAALDYDSLGGDFEGIFRDVKGNFWMCDEYRPAIYKFDPDGNLINRFVADGTSKLGTTPKDSGYYGKETLPAIYAKRRANRGFEAIAYDSTKQLIYAFIQSPMYNPGSGVKNSSSVIRILAIDTSGTPQAEYVYLLENGIKSEGYRDGVVDKIGDAVFIGNGRFYVVERDSKHPSDVDYALGKKYIYLVDLKGATNILDTELSKKMTSPTLEEHTADELMAKEIQPVYKLKVLNLPSIGYNGSDKTEGIALLPGGKIAVLNDNDFGEAGNGASDDISFGIVEFAQNYALDASDKDDDINITNWPVYGMFMSDAISSFSIGDITYFVTANEGDDRGEDERIKDLTLNESYFTGWNNLQEKENLGRLKASSLDGDIDGDGKLEYLHSFGCRSFSIWDQYGNLVWDSGDEIERKIAALLPDFFNVSNDDTDFDSRSDAKGPEPEAIEIVKKDGKTYAYVGLERTSGVIVYDITNPKAPVFSQFFHNRNFAADLDEDLADEGAPDRKLTRDVAPEDVLFIPAIESPNGKDLIAVANEVSGTVSLWQFGDTDLFSLSIMHNNDGESKLTEDGEGYGNVAIFRSTVDYVRKDGKSKGYSDIMLSSGDNFLASPAFSASLENSGKPYYDAVAIDSIDYDAICIGNHDFDFGPDVLAKFIDDVSVSKAPYLSSNLDFSKEDTLQKLVDAGRISATTIVSKGGEKIGVIGLTTPNLPFISSPRKVEISSNIVDTVKEHVKVLTGEGVNKIILISHLQSIKEDTALIAQVSGIDVAIAGGGDELLTNNPADTLPFPGSKIWSGYPLPVKNADGDTTYVITAPGGYKFLGNLRVKFNNAGKIVYIDPSSGPILIGRLKEEEGLKASVITPINNYVKELESNIIATSEVELNGVKSKLRTRETNQGNLIADAILWQAKQKAAEFGAKEPQVAIQNGGGIRNNNVIPAGNITELNTYDMVPFPNFVTIIEDLTPAEFKQILENAVSKVETVSGRFAQLSGCMVEYSPDSTAMKTEDDGTISTEGKRVINVKLKDGSVIIENGKIKLGAPKITIAIVDFLARGGDQYPLANKKITVLGTSYQQAVYNFITDSDNGGLDSVISAAGYPVEGKGSVNAIPQINKDLADISKKNGFNSVEVDLAGVFSDFEEQELTLSAESADNKIATTSVKDEKLTVTEVGNGETTITATATDIHNAMASVMFKVKIEQGNGIDFTAVSKLMVYPNPATDYVTVDFDNNNISFIEILDLSGNVVYNTHPVSDKLQIELQDLPGGSYIIRAKSDAGIHVVKFIVK